MDRAPRPVTAVKPVLARQVGVEVTVLLALFVFQIIRPSATVLSLFWAVLVVPYLRHVRGLWLLDPSEFAERLDLLPSFWRVLRGRPMWVHGPVRTDRFWTVVLPSAVIAPVTLGVLLYAFLLVAANWGVDRATGEHMLAPTPTSVALLVVGGYYLHTVNRCWKVMHRLG